MGRSSLALELLICEELEKRMALLVGPGSSGVCSAARWTWIGLVAAESPTDGVGVGLSREFEPFSWSNGRALMLLVGAGLAGLTWPPGWSFSSSPRGWIRTGSGCLHLAHAWFLLFGLQQCSHGVLRGSLRQHNARDVEAALALGHGILTPPPSSHCARSWTPRQLQATQQVCLGS
ncbi:uncharacterized protein J3D65DRAFT_611770 [Phyllosticta citribraziliensis]|uniref:Uncharacterized protein n=1 Tax=Phyllosticta citribraziliensis TaxID=989973 RepID=A0ABR1MB48_9PEZI